MAARFTARPPVMISPPSSLAALRARYGPRYRWLSLGTVMLGTIASIMASTIVNVAVPDMSQHFTLGQERAQWLAAGFMAAMTVSMPLTPWLLERHGYRRTYAGAVLLLLAGSIAGGLSNSYELVLAMRVTEGLAAGVLQPIPAIIVLRGFKPEEQGRAMGLFGFGVVLAPALGPSIGGVLVEWFGWRSIFFVASPFCLARAAAGVEAAPAQRTRRRRGECHRGATGPDRPSAGDHHDPAGAERAGAAAWRFRRSGARIARRQRRHPRGLRPASATHAASSDAA